MAKYVFGVDIGGTTVKIGLFSVEGDLLDKWEITTRTDEGGKYILGDIAESIKDKMAEKLINKEDVAGIGMGVPGPVKEDGTVWGTGYNGYGELAQGDTAMKTTYKQLKVKDEEIVEAERLLMQNLE